MILHFLLGVAQVAQASSYYIQPFSQFIHETSVIAHGTLSNVHTENSIESSGAKVIYTYATLDLKEVLKGSISGQSLMIREVGGTKDGYTISIPGTPELKAGEDAVFFLSSQNSDQTYEISSLELGKFGMDEKTGNLTGGIFNFVKHNDHAPGDPYPENLHPWTLADVRNTIEKQGGKNAPAATTSTPFVSSDSSHVKGSPNSQASNKDSRPDPESSSAKAIEDSRTPENDGLPASLLYGGFGLAAACLLFFLFRKRR